MRKYFLAFLFLSFVSTASTLNGQNGLINQFPFERNDLKLEHLAQPITPFDKVGRKFAVLGYESGSFEAWAYPLKLLRNFKFSFLLGNSTRPIRGADIVRYAEVTPELTRLTFTYQSFTVKANYITPIDQSGCLILLDVAATEPLTIICSFLPVLQPMWPAGLGGQYAYWDNNLKAYIISEPTRMNHGLVGSPAAVGISYTPAHMLSDTPNEFKIKITDPQKVVGKFIPIIIAGGEGKRENIIKVYNNLAKNPEFYYKKTFDHYRNFREHTLHITTPNQEINLAFEWAKIAYDNLLVNNPDLGKGLVAGLGPSGTSGRPGFGWFFGGDAYINSFSINSYGDYKTVKEAIAFTTKFQRKDGKMAHEISQAAGYIDWFGKYPYPYIHGDTSPFFIDAVYDYYRMTGDRDFVRNHWENIQRAYQWCLATDSNNDGLMDNKKAGLGALEYGKLAGGIETDIYLAAVWVRATFAMQYLAEAAGKKCYTAKVKKDYQKASKAFKEKFWDEKSQFYTYAFNDRGEHVKEFSPWSAVGLMWDLGDPKQSKKTLQRLGSSELSTDWGVRSISRRSKYYQPLNYNYGAVWPFLNSWVATAQFKHHFLLQGYSTLMSTVRHTFDNQLGTINEVFSGSLNTWPQESVPHQGFSTAGVVLPLVRGLFGLEGNAIQRQVSFSPHFPANWKEVSADNYQIGSAVFSFKYTRKKDKLFIDVSAKKADGYTLKLAPAFGIGTGIKSATVNGQSVKYDLIESSQVIQPVITVQLKNRRIHVEYAILPTAELIPPVYSSHIGDPNKGLKIISISKKEDKLYLKCEGLEGESYRICFTNPEMIRSVYGAEKIMDGISVTFPPGQPGEFKEKSIIIEL